MKYSQQDHYYQLIRMIELMMKAHEDQLDIGQRPYFFHPMAVMQKVADRYDDDYELMQIAVGHDLIEDTWVKEDHLKNAGFSDRVISGIVALSKHEGLSYEDYKLQVFANVDAMRVKLYDIDHNSDLRRLGREPKERDLKRLDAYSQFAQELVDRLSAIE